MPNHALATSIGLVSIGMWASLALLTAASGTVPPFQLLAMTFSVGAALGLVSWLFRPGAFRALVQPLPVWLLGIGGLFGYHAVYFAALRMSPPAEASLVAFLWPLLIVLLTTFLPGEQLRWQHIVGAMLGFGGVVVLALGKGTSFDAANLPGYCLALACAFIWSGYSVLSRRFKRVPTDAVVGSCMATALLAVPAHFAFEQTVWPAGSTEWLAILGLGLGPVGIAFYAWDHGVKHGDIRLLGVASYATPILSTFILVVLGYAEASRALALACLLIAAGALLASKDQILRRGTGRNPQVPGRSAQVAEKDANAATMP